MKLIDDKVVERRRLEAGVVPWEVVGLRDDAIPVLRRCVGVGSQSTGIGIALPAFGAGTFDVKLVFIAGLHARHKQRPERAAALALQRQVVPIRKGAAHRDLWAEGAQVRNAAPPARSVAPEGRIGSNLAASATDGVEGARFSDLRLPAGRGNATLFKVAITIPFLLRATGRSKRMWNRRKTHYSGRPETLASRIVRQCRFDVRGG